MSDAPKPDAPPRRGRRHHLGQRGRQGGLQGHRRYRGHPRPRRTSARALAGLRGDKGTPGISVDLREGSVDIDVTMSITFGPTCRPSPRPCARRSPTQVEATTGLPVRAVNVHGHRRGLPGGAGWRRGLRDAGLPERRPAPSLASRPSCCFWRAGWSRLLFAIRLVAAALGRNFSPFPYITPGGGHALLAWLLLLAMAVLAGLVWLVLRHDADALWLVAAAGDGGVLVASEDLERLVAAAAGRAHADVVRAEAELRQRGAEVRGRVHVWARPLADAAIVGAAVERAARGADGAPHRRDLEVARRRARHGAAGPAARKAPAVTPLARVVAVVAGIVSLLVLCGPRSCARRRSPPARNYSGAAPRGGASPDDRSSASHRGRPRSSCVAVVVLLVSSPYRQVAPGEAPQVIEFAVEEGTARLSVPALRKALRRRFETMLPGITVWASGREQGRHGWSVRVEADVPVCDLRDVQRAVLQAFRDDMRKVAGIEIARLDLVVTSMRPVAKKGRDKKKTWESPGLREKAPRGGWGVSLLRVPSCAIHTDAFPAWGARQPRCNARPPPTRRSGGSDQPCSPPTSTARCVDREISSSRPPGRGGRRGCGRPACRPSICTGRMFRSVRKVAARLGLTEGPVVCYQGALVADLGSGERCGTLHGAARPPRWCGTSARWAGSSTPTSTTACTWRRSRLGAPVRRARRGGHRPGAATSRRRCGAGRRPSWCWSHRADDVEAILPGLQQRWAGRLYVVRSQAEYIEFTDASREQERRARLAVRASRGACASEWWPAATA